MTVMTIFAIATLAFMCHTYTMTLWEAVVGFFIGVMLFIGVELFIWSVGGF